MGESSVFESDSARTSGRFGNYRTYNGRKRNESSSRDCPSDAESVTSVASSTNSRIPRYIGRSSRADSESSKLSERDVKQIVKLVKGGDRKVGNRLSPEFVIKKDPVSKKWELRDSSSDLLAFSCTILLIYREFLNYFQVFVVPSFNEKGNSYAQGFF